LFKESVIGVLKDTEKLSKYSPYEQLQFIRKTLQKFFKGPVFDDMLYAVVLTKMIQKKMKFCLTKRISLYLRI